MPHFVFKAVKPLNDDAKRSYLRHGELTTEYPIGETVYPDEGTSFFAFSDLEDAAHFARNRLLGDPDRPRLPEAEIWLAVTSKPPLMMPRVVKSISHGPRRTGSMDTYNAFWRNRPESGTTQNAPHGNIAVRDLKLLVDVTDAAIALLEEERA